MALLTATECTIYSNITASAATIVSSGLIPIIQERICMICNNYFVTDLYIQDCVTFNTTARTIISVGGNSFDDYNFLADDDVRIYNSYRNDGVFTIASVSTSTLTLISGSSVIDELSGRSIMISVVKWPVEIKQVAAQMIAYDYDVRPKSSENLKSKSLGPWSESYISFNESEFGYPKNLISKLDNYKIVRLM